MSDLNGAKMKLMAQALNELNDRVVTIETKLNPLKPKAPGKLEKMTHSRNNWRGLAVTAIAGVIVWISIAVLQTSKLEKSQKRVTDLEINEDYDKNFVYPMLDSALDRAKLWHKRSDAWKAQALGCASRNGEGRP